jgi:DNA-binding phage protein
MTKKKTSDQGTNERIYEEERLLLHCQEAIAAAIEQSQMTRTQVAKRLGKNRSFITQALSSGRNLTLHSLAALAWATGHRVQPSLQSLAVREERQMHTLRFPEAVSYEAASQDEDDDGSGSLPDDFCAAAA